MSNFIVNKGMSNEFIITIKKNDTILPVVIADTDTFKMYMYKLKDNSLVHTSELGNGIVIHDAESGQIKITLAESFVNSLEIERGDRADNYYAKPMYRIALDCNTVDNGKFVAKIDKVYVC